MINKLKLIFIALCYIFPGLAFSENFISKQIELLEQHKQKLLKNQEAFEKLPKISCAKIKISLEDCSPELPIITRKLFLKGFFGKDKYPAEEEYVFEKKHQELIKKFQKARFVKESGIFDQKTCHFLNQSIKYDISLITKNILRLKKVEHDNKLSKKAIFVNIPHFKLWMIENFISVDSMRTITGRYAMQTPIRHEMLYAVVFNPKWVIPPTILKNKLPTFSKDPKDLGKKNITILDKDKNIILPEEIDWDDIKKNQHLYRFEQAPGEKNVLGRLKFLLSNDDAIYLHGTNLPKLFDENSRDLSSGCVRVEKPQKLAAWLIENLKNTKCTEHGEESQEFSTCLQNFIKGKIETEKTYRLSVGEEIPVLLEYISTWIHEDGMLYLSDPYKMDIV